MSFLLFDVELPKAKWLESDAQQFRHLNEQIGGKVEGFTWHHHQDSGRMQLIPMGLHKLYNHHGGRSPGNWAYGNR